MKLYKYSHIHDFVYFGLTNLGMGLLKRLLKVIWRVFRRNAFRYAGVIERAYLIDEMKVEVIGDGIHLPAPLLKLIYKIKGPDKIALVTDSMRGAGMPEGESILGSLKKGLRVIIEDGVAKLPDLSAFASSVATTDRVSTKYDTIGGSAIAGSSKDGFNHSSYHNGC